MKENISINQNIEQSLTSYKPVIFWKDKDTIKQQLKLFSIKNLEELIKKINNLECLVKKNSQVSNLLINNFILETLSSNN